jgi:hypothetical protein
MQNKLGKDFMILMIDSLEVENMIETLLDFTKTQVMINTEEWELFDNDNSKPPV